MIQEHLSLKRLQSNIFGNQELGNLNRFPVKGFTKATTMGFRYWKRSTISGVSGIK
jgi:hypothetical protein